MISPLAPPAIQPTINATQPQTAIAAKGASIASQAPGRDLMLFLLLLFVIDMSSVLHIYGLQYLYGEALFTGLGFVLLLLALLLLIMPRIGRPVWLRLPFAGPWPVVGLYAVGIIAAAGVALLLRATFEPPEWYPFDPNAPADPFAPLKGIGYLLAAFLGLPLLAAVVAYTRNELVRRAALALLACFWFVMSLVNLLLMLGVPANGNGWAPNTWAALLNSGWSVIAGAVALLVMAGLVTIGGPRVFMLVALAAGLTLRLVGMIAVPVSMALGDMLPLIGMSTGRLLDGQTPYVVYQMPWDLPLTYWPLTVLTYTPFAALHIDLRYANLLLGPLLLALLWRPSRRNPAAAYAFGLLYLTPAMLQWDMTTAAPPFWIWLCGGLAMAGLRAPLSGWGIGLALAAGPLALPFAPVLFVRWLRGGVKVALGNSAAVVLALLLIVGPFMLADFAGFWGGAVAWFNDINSLPRLKWTTDRTWLLEAGLAGQFWQAGLEGWLKPLQLLLLAALALWALLRQRLTVADSLRLGTAGYLLFMIFNTVIWPYLYVPVLLGLIFVLREAEEYTSFDGCSTSTPVLN